MESPSSELFKTGSVLGVCYPDQDTVRSVIPRATFRLLTATAGFSLHALTHEPSNSQIPNTVKGTATVVTTWPALAVRT